MVAVQSLFRYTPALHIRVSLSKPDRAAEYLQLKTAEGSHPKKINWSSSEGGCRGVLLDKSAEAGSSGQRGARPFIGWPNLPAG